MHVIINGVSSETLQGVQILSLPPITKPRMRTSIATIDGRPGDIVTRLGYEAYNRKIEVLLHHNYDVYAVTAFFNQSGTIIFSNEPDMIYQFETIDAFDFERAVRFRTGTVTFHVQPYKTSASEQPSEAESDSFMDSEPYLFRESPDATMMIDEIVGGSVVFNQLCNAASVTVANGHKYFMKKGTTYSLGASTGTAITGLTSGSDMVIDLTLMFGPTIADYIYTQEQSTAGAGVALAKAWAGITADYYPYDAGSIKSVTGLTAHKMTGFNLFDKSAVSTGKWLSTRTGLEENAANYVVSDYIPVFAGKAVYIPATSTARRWFYDSGKNPVAYLGNAYAQVYTPPTDGYIRVTILIIGNGALSLDDICINISDPSKNGTYEPYTVYSYPLDSSLTLRGIPKLVNNQLVYDGDVYPPSGQVQRNWAERAYQNGDTSNGTTMITDGTSTVYKLNSPTTETAEPYTALQTVYDGGTEEYVTDSIPVGHNTKYLVPIEMTVTNSGNTDSAPSITITGSGAIEVTVDGLIAFEISMPSTGTIVIDSAAMDATDGDGNLANRSVSGDYSNMRLAPGEHTIIISGDAASVSLQNVSRWI